MDNHSTSDRETYTGKFISDSQVDGLTSAFLLGHHRSRSAGGWHLPHLKRWNFKSAQTSSIHSLIGVIGNEQKTLLSTSSCSLCKRTTEESWEGLKSMAREIHGHKRLAQIATSNATHYCHHKTAAARNSFTEFPPEESHYSAMERLTSKLFMLDFCALGGSSLTTANGGAVVGGSLQKGQVIRGLIRAKGSQVTHLGGTESSSSQASLSDSLFVSLICWCSWTKLGFFLSRALDRTESSSDHSDLSSPKDRAELQRHKHSLQRTLWLHDTLWWRISSCFLAWRWSEKYKSVNLIQDASRAEQLREFCFHNYFLVQWGPLNSDYKHYVIMTIGRGWNRSQVWFINQ